jgi:hypothetical protein
MDFSEQNLLQTNNTIYMLIIYITLLVNLQMVEGFSIRDGPEIHTGQNGGAAFLDDGSGF